MTHTGCRECEWVGSRGDAATFHLEEFAQYTPVFLDRNGDQWYQLRHWRGFFKIKEVD